MILVGLQEKKYDRCGVLKVLAGFSKKQIWGQVAIDDTQMKRDYQIIKANFNEPEYNFVKVMIKMKPHRVFLSTVVIRFH